jgi:hypothetical protein
VSLFEDAMAAADVDLFAFFGNAATAQRGADAAVPVTVVIDRNVEMLGEYGQVVQRVDRISLRNSEWIAQQGDMIVIGAESRKVDKPLDDDGLVNTAVLFGVVP